MSSEMRLHPLIQNTMSDLISAYRLTSTEVADDEVLLRSEGFSLDVFANRDGVNILYLDTKQKPVKGYNLYLFLLNKRRESLTFSTETTQWTTHAEFVESELKSLAQHIRNAGRDIMGGSREWLKGYSWPVIRPDERLAPLI